MIIREIRVQYLFANNINRHEKSVIIVLFLFFYFEYPFSAQTRIDEAIIPHAKI